jgi:hypothetical protein
MGVKKGDDKPWGVALELVTAESKLEKQQTSGQNGCE